MYITILHKSFLLGSITDLIIQAVAVSPSSGFETICNTIMSPGFPIEHSGEVTGLTAKRFKKSPKRDEHPQLDFDKMVDESSNEDHESFKQQQGGSFEQRIAKDKGPPKISPLELSRRWGKSQLSYTCDMSKFCLVS